QRIHVGRYFAAVFVDERLGHADERSRFRPEKTSRQNLWLELFGRRLGERLRVRIPSEQGWRDHVHTLISRLCRQNRRLEQLERVPVVKLRIRIRMLGLEFLENVSGFDRSLHVKSLEGRALCNSEFLILNSELQDSMNRARSLVPPDVRVRLGEDAPGVLHTWSR